MRAQFEKCPLIRYDPDAWNEAGHYDAMDSRQLIAFWAAYNQQLLALLRLLPEAALERLVDTGTDHAHTLEFLICDYVGHLEHHLRQVVDY